MDAISHAFAPRVHKQTAQSRQPCHHDRCFACAGAAHRDHPALFRKWRIRFRVRLSHPDIFIPRPDRRDVSWADQQRRRYHPRPSRAATRAQCQCSPVILRDFENAHPWRVCADSMRPLVLIGNYVLQIRGMFWIYLGIMLMTAMGGVSLGLLISSLVADPKTAANI